MTILSKLDFEWQHVQMQADRYFDDAEKVRDWLTHVIINPIEQALAQR